MINNSKRQRTGFRTVCVMMCAAIIALSQSACSNRFTYNQLDWLIPWYVDDYVDLTAEQSDEFDRRLAPVLTWHRTEEIETLIALLDSIEQSLDAPLTQAQVTQWISEVQASIRRVEIRLLDVLIQTGTDLTDKQVASVIENLAEKQAELQKKYLTRTDQDYAEDSAERLIENLENYLGRLDAKQKTIVKDATGAMLRFDRQWLAERDQWIMQVKTLLQRQPGWQQSLKAAHAARVKNRPGEYEAVLRHNLTLISRAIAKVINQGTERQQKLLRQEVASLKTDLQQISSAEG